MSEEEKEKELSDDSNMPFGQYGPKRGDCRKMRDVPPEYLLWLWDDGVWEQHWRPIHWYIKAAFSALVLDAKDYIASHYPEGYKGPRS